MTVTALLSVAPVSEGSMAEDVADAIRALEDFDVGYETNDVGTVIYADDVGTLLEAVEAAHRAVDADRVSTLLKIDDERTDEERTGSKVGRVEAALGREARSEWK